MHTEKSHLILLGILNLPVYWLFWRFFFDDWADFLDCVRFYLTPDIISMFRGEWGRDWWASLRLGMFCGLCVVAVLGEYQFFFAASDAAFAALSNPAASG